MELLYETDADNVQALLHFLGEEIKPPFPPKFSQKPERNKIEHQ